MESPRTLSSFFLCLMVSFTFAASASASSGGETKHEVTPPANIPSSFNEVDRAIVSRFPKLMDHSRISDKCLNCHQAQFRDIQASIHGKAGLLKELPPGALCLTCHEVNHIVQDPVKARNYQLDPFETLPKDVACMRCHSDPTVGKAFNFPPHVPSEFEQSIHFRKAMLGERRAPLCFDCHGAHNIVRVENPSSPVHDAQKVKVCAQCHPGANATFAATFDHTPTTWETKPVEFFVTVMFKVLTLGTFIALGLYILLEMMAMLRQKLLPGARAEHAHPKPAPGKQKFVKRLDGHQRLQHFLMFGSVITLCLTGWPLLAPTSSVAQAMMRALGGAGSVAMIHRIAGFIMIGDFIYHVIYLYWRFRQGGRWHPMTPVPKDIADLWGMMLYFFGLRSKKPDFGQFSFFEKFDYWAVFWGVAMMGFSGVILTFPTVITHILPKYAITLANIIHADEALLAAMVLFIWHFYNVHLKPGVFPMNWAWLTGRMKKELYEEEHAGHVEELKRKGKWEE